MHFIFAIPLLSICVYVLFVLLLLSLRRHVQVMLDVGDRAVVLKPPGWEVHDGHRPFRQLKDFMKDFRRFRRCGGSCGRGPLAVGSGGWDLLKGLVANG